MPSYDFKNKETGEIIELKMSMAELDKYKDEHPEMERYFGNQAPATMYGKPKQSDGLKETYQYGSPQGDRTHWGQPRNSLQVLC